MIANTAGTVVKFHLNPSNLDFSTTKIKLPVYPAFMTQSADQKKKKKGKKGKKGKNKNRGGKHAQNHQTQQKPKTFNFCDIVYSKRINRYLAYDRLNKYIVQISSCLKNYLYFDINEGRRPHYYGEDPNQADGPVEDNYLAAILVKVAGDNYMNSMKVSPASTHRGYLYLNRGRNVIERYDPRTRRLTMRFKPVLDAENRVNFLEIYNFKVLRGDRILAASIFNTLRLFSKDGGLTDRHQILVQNGELFAGALDLSEDERDLLIAFKRIDLEILSSIRWIRTDLKSPKSCTFEVLCAIQMDQARVLGPAGEEKKFCCYTPFSFYGQVGGLNVFMGIDDHFNLICWYLDESDDYGEGVVIKQLMPAVVKFQYTGSTHALVEGGYFWSIAGKGELCRCKIEAILDE